MKAAALDARVWYAASNEDSASEVRALAPAGRDILAITASGSRTFDLLIADPASILSIDQNPAQTAFAQGLADAYRQPHYAAFAAHAGIERDDGRVYSGRWEAFLRTIHRLAGARRRALALRLLDAPDVAAQYDLWRNEWDDRAWRWFLKALSWRFLWRHIAREPGIAFVPREFDIAAYVAARFDHAARSGLFRDSPFAWLMLTGRYVPHVLPPYLSRDGYDAIRDRLDRVRFETASLQAVLADGAPGRFDAASLSDYSSYCDVDVQRGVWAGLARALRPGGRVCERKFFNKTGLDLPQAAGFARDPALEDALFAADRAWFYSFVVAERR